jgi:hypothetical protein
VIEKKWQSSRSTIPLLVAAMVIASVAACSSHKPGDEARIAVDAAHDATVSQNGATLFLPAGSIDRSTTARIRRTTETPPDGAPVPGYDFDIGDATVVGTVRITLPVAEEPHTAPDGTVLVPYLSHGTWGTEVGHYDPTARAVTVEVRHLSWYGDMATVVYQLLRKTLGQWLGHFRADPPKCGAGPQMRYALATIGEPPVLACVSGSDSSGKLYVANNRGFFLMINPERGLTIDGVKIDGALDTVTSGGGAVIRYLTRWNSLPLPPTATAVFNYQAVAGGPTLAFEPDQAATFVSMVLSLFSGISDAGALWLHVFDCIHARIDAGNDAGAAQDAWAGCIADTIADKADEEWIGPGQTVKFAGLTVSRSLLGLLSVVLRAIPALDMAIESRDGGSQDTIQIDAAPRSNTGATTPAPNGDPTTGTAIPPPLVGGDTPPATDPGQTDLPAGARELGPVDLDRYCAGGWGMHAMIRYQNTWGWRCSPNPVPASGLRKGDQNISVDDACAEQYQPSARSHYRTYDDPDSWFCWAPPG